MSPRVATLESSTEYIFSTTRYQAEVSQVAADFGNGRGDVRHVGVIGAVNEAHERSHAGIGAGTRGGTALLTARVEKLN
jgi:hypothetical protein